MNRFLLFGIAVTLLALLLTGIVLLAQNDTLSLAWTTADGGGGRMDGGEYSLQGTIGQMDAGQMQGGEYTLSSGYWPGACRNGLSCTAADVGGDVYLPAIMRQ